MMRKLALFLFALFLLFFQSFFYSSLIPSANALNAGVKCKIVSIVPNPPTASDTQINSITIESTASLPSTYNVYIDARGGSDRINKIKTGVEISGKLIKVTGPFNKEGGGGSSGDKFEAETPLTFWVTNKSYTNDNTYPSSSFSDMDNRSFCRTEVTVGEGVEGGVSDESKCSILASGTGAGKPVHLKVNFTDTTLTDGNETYSIAVKAVPAEVELGNYGPHPWSTLRDGIELSKGADHIPTIFDVGTYQATVLSNGIPFNDTICSSLFTVTDTGISNPDNEYDAGLGLFACTPDDPTAPKVYTCHTALGKVTTDADGFIKTILSLILGLAGGILLIVIILNGYKFMVSQGDPEKIKDAREGIVAAIMGIFLIIFSLTILTIITSNILDIPGFGR